MPHKNKSWSIWILASHGLQRWLISSEGVEKLVYECDVERIIRDCYCERIFENFSGAKYILSFNILFSQFLEFL